jgi:hypothetical protein
MPLQPTHAQIKAVFLQQGFPLHAAACQVIAAAVANQWNQHQAVVQLAITASVYLDKIKGWVYNANQMRLVVWKAKQSGMLA